MVGLPRLSNTSKALISTILLMRSFTPFVQEKFVGADKWVLIRCYPGKDALHFETRCKHIPVRSPSAPASESLKMQDVLSFRCASDVALSSSPAIPAHAGTHSAAETPTRLFSEYPAAVIV